MRSKTRAKVAEFPRFEKECRKKWILDYGHWTIDVVLDAIVSGPKSNVKRQLSKVRSPASKQGGAKDSGAVAQFWPEKNSIYPMVE